MKKYISLLLFAFLPAAMAISYNAVLWDPTTGNFVVPAATGPEFTKVVTNFASMSYSDGNTNDLLSFTGSDPTTIQTWTWQSVTKDYVSVTNNNFVVSNAIAANVWVAVIAAGDFTNANLAGIYTNNTTATFTVIVGNVSIVTPDQSLITSNLVINGTIKGVPSAVLRSVTTSAILDGAGSEILWDNSGNILISPNGGSILAGNIAAGTISGTTITGNGFVINAPTTGTGVSMLELNNSGQVITNPIASSSPPYNVSVSGGYGGSAAMATATLEILQPNAIATSTFTTSSGGLWVPAGGPGGIRTITNIALSVTGSTGPLPVTTNLSMFILTNVAGSLVAGYTVAGVGGTFNCDGSTMVTNFVDNIKINSTNLFVVGLSNGSPSTVVFKVNWIIQME